MAELLVELWGRSSWVGAARSSFNSYLNETYATYFGLKKTKSVHVIIKFRPATVLASRQPVLQHEDDLAPVPGSLTCLFSVHSTVCPFIYTTERDQKSAVSHLSVVGSACVPEIFSSN